MDLSTFTSSNITLSGGITLSAFSFSTSTSKNILTATLSDTLAANTNYSLTVGTGVKSSNGIPLPSAYGTTFTTSGSSDLTAPVIVGVIPTNGTTVAANTNDFVFTFDDNIDSTTATSGAITLGITDGANLPASISYLPVAKEGHIIPNNVLPVGQSLTLTLKGASIKNVSGVYLGSNVTKSWTVSATNNDSTAPSIIQASADDFSVAVTFNEAINQTDAVNLSNYTLTVGGVAQTLSALAGQSLIYDGTTRTVKLAGIRITSGAQFIVTASGLRDISGNAMTSVSSFTGTAASFATSGGNFGPGSFSGSTFGEVKNFTASGIGFMPPVTIRPQSTFISASTTYGFELPIATQIPADGTIVVTFPSSSDFSICCVATTSSSNPSVATQNTDINGPGTGTVGIKTITADTLAKTVTLTLDTATRSENSDTHDFLRFTIAGLKNPSIPKGIDSSGYVLDIKSKNASGVLLESFNANPVYIGGGTAGGGSVTTIRGVVSGNGSNLKDVPVHLMSPSTGPQDATTDANGLYQFTNIPVGSQFLSNNFGGGNEYMVFIEPFITGVSDENGATTTNFFGNTMPSPVIATSTSLIGKNFSLTPANTASIAANFTVRLTAAANTFTAAETLDVFAGGPGQFVSRTITPGASALSNSTLTTVPIPKVNGSWGVGISPPMPKGGGFSGPPPSPNWSMPKPIEVKVSGCPSACVTSVSGFATTSNIFTISTADKTISGVLKDGSGNAIASAMVFAFSPSTDAGGGTGNSTQSSTVGAFSIKVVAGTYVVGAYSPGIGESKKVTVVVDSSGNVFVDGNATASTGSSGANPFTLKMVKPDYSITGQVTDGSSAVGNAPVFAYRTDAPGHADAMSDSSTGNYTLYVSNGTWKVSSFIPGFGPMAEQTVTVSGSSQSNINFAPSSSQTFSILSGNIYEDTNRSDTFTAGEGLSGAVIRVSNGTNVNEGVSSTDGAYTVRVPSGTGYKIQDIFSPTYGRIAPIGDSGAAIGTINLTASTTKNIRIPIRGTVSIIIKDSSGNPLTVPKAFIDLFDNTTGLGNHVEIDNGTTTSILMASSTSAYTVKAYIQGIPPANISVASDDAGTTVTSGRITINRATEYIKIVVNTASAGMSTISGTVYKDSATSGNELEGAWIQFVDQTNGVQFGTQSTSSGRYSIKALDGTYQILVSKPQYVATPTTLVVSGATTQNMTMTQSSLTISGTVTSGGVAAASSFVRGEKVGGGQAITQTDTNGTYTLNVTPGTWRVFAAADGYAEAGYASNPLTVSSSQSSINVALSTAASVQSKLATSNTFSDTSAGTFSDTTVNLKVSVDANAFGSAGASSYFTAKETTNYPNTTSVNIVANKAKDISAFSGGSQVTNLASGKTADVELTYTVAELATSNIDTTTEVGKLTVVSYSSDKGDWETLSTVATYKDSAGDVVASPNANLSNVSSVSFIASGTHFSAYALSSSEGVSPPDAPTGVTATPATNVARVTLTWTASPDAEGYYVYRDTSAGGTFPLIGNPGNTTSYTDNAVSISTTYLYKVSAFKSSGASESSPSSAVSATTLSGGGGGGGGGAAASPSPAPAASTPVVATPAPVAKPAVKETIGLAIPVSTSGTNRIVIGHKFLKVLKIGNKGNEVKALQDILEAQGHLKMPKGVAKGTFGSLTKEAIKKFQKANNIAKEGQPGFGDLGPKTRAKLNEMAVVETPKTEAEPAKAPEASKSASVMTSEAKTALISTLLQQIQALQEVLKGLKAGQ
ncbi:MAG: peptidoglycan-binding protein [bacterium]|nr:peptidoglycan-binding protein [bacterium]